MMQFLEQELSPSFTNPNNASAYVLPVPYEKTTTYMKGTANGPQAIIESSQQLETFDIELKTEPYKKANGIYTAPVFQDEYSSPEEYISALKERVYDMLALNKFCILLGGEHTLSLAPYLACKQLKNDCSVLHIDAHTDMRDTYEGTPFNHACVMRRIREHTTKTVSLGIRSTPAEDYEYIKKNKVPVFFTELYKDKLPPINKVLDNLSKNVFITIDIDGLDTSIMPAVGTPEPGGLAWEQLLGILKAVFKNKNVIACDIVELNPSPQFEFASFIAAKLVYKIIGYKFCL